MILHKIFSCLCFIAALTLAAPALANPGLTGSWRGELMGNALTLTLDGQGSGTLDGDPIRYQTMGNALIIDEDGEITAYQFELKNGRLLVSGGDLPGVLSLSKGKSAASAAVPGGAEKTEDKSAGGLRQELVGKWCQAATFLANGGGGSQRSRCFELRANGTYSYAAESSMDAYGGSAWGGASSGSSDSGRWSATASSITAQSASGQSTRYRLEKKNHPKNRDPMLCLDGECYVTYWKKAPW